MSCHAQKKPSCSCGLSCSCLFSPGGLSCPVCLAPESCPASVFSPGGLLIPPNFPREIFFGGRKGSGCRGCLAQPEVSMHTLTRPEIQDGGDMQLAHWSYI